MNDSSRLMLMVVFLCGLFAGSAFSSASDHNYSPADFGEGESSVVAKFEMPSVPGDGTLEIAVICQALINPNGNATNAHCIAPQEHESTGAAVLEAINIAMFKPASIDGDAMTVLMNMMAVSQCSDRGVCGVSWRPNHGRHERQFGSGYFAPQPIIDSDTWYEKYPEKLEWIKSSQSIYDVGGAKFLVSAQVDETGEASDNRVDFLVPDHHRYRYWAGETARSLKGVHFIPAHFQSKPTPMRLYEYWVDPQVKGDVWVVNGIPQQQSLGIQDSRRRARHDTSYLYRSVWWGGVFSRSTYKAPTPPK